MCVIVAWVGFFLTSLGPSIDKYRRMIRPLLPQNYVLLRWETLAGKVAQYSRGIPRVLALWILFLPISACYANLSLPFLLPSGHRYQPASVPPVMDLPVLFFSLSLSRPVLATTPQRSEVHHFLSFFFLFLPVSYFCFLFFPFCPHFILAQLNRECGNMIKYAKSLASSEVFARGAGGRILL